MAARVAVRELRQNLSRYLARVKEGEELIVTERGREVARLLPHTPHPYYAELAERYGATIPTGRLEDVVAGFTHPPAPAGTTDAFIDETRRDRL